MDIFKFLRRSEAPVVADNTSPGATAAKLYTDVAIEDVVTQMTRIPDPDEVLQQAGVPRHKLSVLLYDDEIAQAFETRLDALLSVPMRLEPSEGDQAVELEKMIKPRLRDAVSAIFKARMYGYSVMEAVYTQRPEGGIGLGYLGEKPFEWFEPKRDGSLVYFPVDGSGGGGGVIVDQTFKFFLTRNRATYKNPYGEALLTRLYWPWYFRQNGWKFWGKFLERFGTPLIVGKSSDPKKMVAAILAAHSNAALGVGPDDSVETVGTNGSNSPAFEAFEAAALRRIQKVVLGQTLTSGTDNGSGNRALGQVHESVRMDKRNSDIALVEETMQRVVNAICLLNGYEPHTINFADGVGLEVERAKRDRDLHTLGVRFSPDYFVANYDLNVEDFTLTSEADNPALPPGAADDGGAPPDDGDVPPKPGVPVKASQRPSHLFTRKAMSRFTKAQERVEQEANEALAVTPSPIPTEDVRAAIMAASDPEDLEARLFTLIGEDTPPDEFTAVLERALYAADVLGYVNAAGKT